MAQARFKDFVCVCVDVGSLASQSAPQWQDVLQRILATRMIHNRAHLEVAIILYGSDNTENDLWSEEQPGDYAGVDVVSEFAPCTVETYDEISKRVVGGTQPSDHFFALTTAADMLKRTITARKMGAARKSIVFASPFVDEVPAIPDEHLEGILTSLAADGGVTISAAVSAWVPAIKPSAAAARSNACREFRKLHSLGALGAVEFHDSPYDLFSLVRAHSAPTMTKNILKVSDFEINISTCKLTSSETLPSFKPYTDDGASLGRPDTFYERETEYHIKGDSSKPVNLEARQKMYRFGEEYFPALDRDAYQWKAASDEADFKGIQVLCFVPDTLTVEGRAKAEQEDADCPDPVPRWALQDCPTGVFPATEHAAATISALAHGLRRSNKVALVRYVLTANRPMNLGVLAPRVLDPSPNAQGLDRCPDHFLLIKLAWGNEYNHLTLPGIEDVVDTIELQDDQIDAVQEFVRCRTVLSSTAHKSHIAHDAEVKGMPPPDLSNEEEAEAHRASGVTLPSDRACDAMRSRFAKVVAEHSTAVVMGTATGSPKIASLTQDAMANCTLLLTPAVEERSMGAAHGLHHLFPSLIDQNCKGLKGKLHDAKELPGGDATQHAAVKEERGSQSELA